MQLERPEYSLGVIQDSAGPSGANVFRAHAPPQGACEHLVSQVAGESADGRGQPRAHDLSSFAGAEHVEDHA